MVVLPDGSLEDKIVHASIPRFFIRKFNLLGSDVEGREVVALGCLHFERRCVGSDVRGDIIDHLLCSLTELRCVGAKTIKFHNDWNRDDDGPSERLDDRDDNRQ